VSAIRTRKEVFRRADELGLLAPALNEHDACRRRARRDCTPMSVRSSCPVPASKRRTSVGSALVIAGSRDERHQVFQNPSQGATAPEVPVEAIALTGLPEAITSGFPHTLASSHHPAWSSVMIRLSRLPPNGARTPNTPAAVCFGEASP
jgi:hypothetical protein